MADFQRYFRLVSDLRDQAVVDGLLEAEGFEAWVEDFFPLARRLVKAPFALGRSLAASFGRVYIQDKASMLPPLALDCGPGDLVLDLCASPGGKTGMLAQMVGPQGLVLANEPHSGRRAVLSANLRQLSLSNVVTTCVRGEELVLSQGLDYILVDAPCSGWGTSAKNPQVQRIWHADNVHRLISLQRRLLAKAASLCAPGGVIVYSTCTTNPQENSAQVRWAEEHLDLSRDALAQPRGFVCTSKELSQGLIAVQGQASASQGFFVARLKKGETAADGLRSDPGWRDLVPGAEEATQEVRDGLPGLATGVLDCGRVLAYGQRLVFMPALLQRVLPADATWQGLSLGRRKKGGILVDPRARWLLPQRPGPLSLDLQDVQELMAIKRGQRLPCKASGKNIGLYFKGLALGWARKKAGQVLWSEP